MRRIATRGRETLSVARKRPLTLLCLAALLAGCGSSTTFLIKATPQGALGSSPHAAQDIGFPYVATKNTTRVDGGDPVADAAGVALAEYPSSASGSQPSVVVLAPTDDWQAAIASSVFSAPPLHAPILLSSSSSLPSATKGALSSLTPSGSGAAGGAQVIRVGDVPAPSGLRQARISGSDSFALASAINRFVNAVAGRPSGSVVVVSTDDPGYAMPAAGWAAESGDPILFVSGSSVPSATRQALQSDQHPHIYILGPTSVISSRVSKQLSEYGSVKRITGSDPSASSVAFAIYRDPPCPVRQPCVHVPGSFGWALRSPGHGYVLLNQSRPLDAAAAAPLSASGSYGAQLVLDSGSKLPSSLLNFFLNYATPGFTAEGPTAAVYNHAWIIGNQQAVSVPVQAEVDSLLEAVPQK